MNPTHEQDLAALLADRSWLERLARRLVHDPGAADDLVQETMVRAWHRAPRSAVKSLARRRGWLIAVLRRLVLQHRRSEGRRAEHEREAPLLDYRDEAAVERAQMRRDLVDEVLQLPEPERTAVVHRYLEERDYSEIAALHDISEPAARKRVSRGIARLQQRLDQRHGGRPGWVFLLAPGVHLGTRASAASAAATQGAAAIQDKGAWWLAMKTSTKLACAGLLAVGIGTLAWVASQRESGMGGEPTHAAEAAGIPSDNEAFAQVDTGAPRHSVAASPAEDPSPGAPMSSLAFPERPESFTGTLALEVQWQDGAPASRIAARISPYGDRRGYLRARRYRTDDEGRIVLHGLSAGWVAVALDRCRGSTYLIEPGAVSEGRLTIPRGFRVEGTVTGPDGGPVAGAEVLMTGYGNSHGVRVVAITDATGHYAIRDVEAVRDVSARAVGFSPSLTAPLGDHPPGAVHLVDLALRSGAGRLSGVVHDPSGIPIRGALVEVQPPGIVEGYRAQGRHATETWTDEEGRFDFDACGSGDLGLSVRTELHQPYQRSFKVAPGEELEVAIEMEIGAVLTGQVTRADESPATSASLTLNPKNGYIPRGLHVRVDSNGSFRLTGLGPGTYDVYATELDKGRARSSVEIAGRETKRLDLKLEVGRIVSGRVIDERGEPLAGWIVGTKVAQGGWDRTTRSRADGSFGLVNVRPDAAELDVAIPEGRRVGTVVRVPITDESLTVRVPDALRPSASLSLRVLVGGRAPSPPAVVGWSPETGDGYVSGFTDAIGEVTIRGLRPGAGRIRVEAAGFPEAIRTGTLEPGENLDIGTIQLSAGGTVKVELRPGPGVQLEQVPGQVTLLHEDGRTSTFFDLVDGVGESKALGAGRYQITTGWSVILDGPRWITVADGETAFYQAAVQPAAAVELTVDSPLPGLLRAGFFIEVRRPDGSLVRRERDMLMRGGPQHVTVQGLAPGRYTIRLDANRGLSGQVECDVPAADPKASFDQATLVRARIELRAAAEQGSGD